MSSPSPSPTPAAHPVTYFAYVPNEGADILAIVLFGLIALPQMYRKVPYLVIIASLCECAGYIFRLLSSQNPQFSTSLASNLLILLAPNIVAANNYVTLGRYQNYVGDNGTWLSRHPTWIAKIFLLSDGMCFLLGGAGADDFLSTDPKKIQLGKNIILASLGIQLSGTFTFVSFIGLIQYKLVYTDSKNPEQYAKLRRGFICLYITTTLLVCRGVYRMVEFGSGIQQLLTKEIWLYLFDFLPIFLAMVIYPILNQNVPTTQEVKTTKKAAETELVALEPEEDPRTDIPHLEAQSPLNIDRTEGSVEPEV